MKASIVIPVYNGDRYIKNAVDSALSQTYEDKEIIIIDDNSTDKTEEIIKKSYAKYIKQGKIKYYKNQKNMERSYSRNRGVDLSSGDIIFFLDHDDEWEDTYVEEVICNMENYDIVYSVPITFIDSEGKVKRISKKDVPENVAKLIFSGYVGYPSCSAFRKTSFLRYDENLNYREDWEIFLRSYLNKVKIREHENRSSKKNIQMLKNTLLIYEKYKNYVPDEYKPYLYFHIGDMCLRYGNLPKGWEFVIKSLRKKEILTARNILNILKRGFRIDKYIRYHLIFV